MFDKSKITAGLLARLRVENPEIDDVAAQRLEGSVERLAASQQAQQPPTVAMIGLSGVGKSSTINALFGRGDQAVSHTRPCTSVARPVSGDLYEYVGQKATIVIYDMPGLGESRAADIRHYQAYEEVLPIVDVVVWIIDSPSRVITPIESALKKLRRQFGAPLMNKFIVAANKIDRVHPEDWLQSANMPSEQQDKVIEEYSQFLSDALGGALPRKSLPVVCYSATRRYNLEDLMLRVVDHAPRNRAWLFGEAADVADFREFVDPRYLKWIKDNESRIRKA